MTDSVIKQIKDRDGFSLANEHIAIITGQRRIPKPIFYHNKENGHEYCYLAGGIGWPRDIKNKPGFAVVVAVDKPKTPDEKPVMRCLEEIEAPTIDGLLKKCVALQQKYGCKECIDLFRIWYGDAERADTSVTLFNHEATKDPDKIFVVAPYDFEKPNAFERHVNQIFSSLTVDPATGKKRLKVGECTRLRNHIQNAPVDVAVKGDIKDYPALAALGGVVHSLMMLMPWLGFSKPERTTPTIQDPLTEPQKDHDQDWWENESDDYGEQEEYDDGALVGTE